MSNVTEFPVIEPTIEQKYQAVLEENLALRKRLEQNDEKLVSISSQVEKYAELEDRLRLKRKGMQRRAKTMAEVDTIEPYKVLRDPEKFPALFDILRSCRWPIQNATTAYNLSVSKRRHVKGVSKKFTAWANRNPKHLTMMRIVMNRYSGNLDLNVRDIVKDAAEHNISKSAVYAFLKDSLNFGALGKDSRGHYVLTKQTIDDYFYNMITMIFSKETIRLVTLLNKVYGMVDLEVLNISGSGYGGHRMKNIGVVKEAKTTAYMELLKIFEQNLTE